MCFPLYAWNVHHRHYHYMLTVYRRHVLTGSYHNYFRIYDTDTLNDIVLQADKSAFKAKKIGGPLPGAKAGIKNGPRVGGLRDAMQLETLDFNKKILHASWHPRENTIAVGKTFMSYSSFLTALQRSLRRIICSCIAPHEFNQIKDTYHCLSCHYLLHSLRTKSTLQDRWIPKQGHILSQ